MENLDQAPVATGADALAILIIDLSAPEAADAIAAACRDWGFFQIVGHGVDSSVLRAVQEEARAFFAAPKPLKRALSRSKDNPWGFFDRELTKTARDKKEIFDIGPDAGADGARDGPFDGATPWPPWRAHFASVMRAHFAASEAISKTLLGYVSAGLGAPRHALATAFAPRHTSFLRLNYYPVEDPLAGETDEYADLGIHHHTDAGALTLLLQDEVSGLQVYRAGAWHDVAPLADAFVVNIGDMVQVWSNDLYRAPVHRVLAMEQSERRSLAFFYNPAYAAAVTPLPNLLSAAPAKYRAIPWGEFRRRRADGDFADYGREVQIGDYRTP